MSNQNKKEFEPAAAANCLDLDLKGLIVLFAGPEKKEVEQGKVKALEHMQLGATGTERRKRHH